MSKLLSVVEGWTEELGPFVLKVDGTPFALTGYAVALILTPTNGTAVTVPSGQVRQDADQVAHPGAMYFTPKAGDLLAHITYTARWKVTDGAGKIVFFPNGAPDTIVVYQP